MGKILIVGANGQLGREFVKKIQNCYAFGKEELDITDFSKVLKVIKDVSPDIVINCSAYNLVDRAEDEFEKALSINTMGVMNLAIACKETDALFVHYSTDYVFDGAKEGVYTEDDTPNPLNRYGLTKYLGEKVISTILDSYLIFRTSWIYGKGKQNFLYKLNQWAQTQEYLKVACDEFSVPTSTRTIVEVSLRAIEEGLTGLYHLTNSGYASRYEWAKEYFRIKGINKFVYPAYQSDFNLPAKRPRWSVMSNDRICKNLKVKIRDWKEELKQWIEKEEGEEV
ncbi:MAG: dTDP-4-dehydrorhamnose reductase [Nitrososphaerales archaeon]